MAQTQPTILIIDDDQMIADAMGRALTLAGYQTLRADTGKKGLALALAEHPDLIILDYNMPSMSGLDVLDKLRADLWGHSAKVIFATNVYDVGAVNEVLRLGVKDYIMKSDLAVGDLVALVGKYVKLPPTGTEA